MVKFKSDEGSLEVEINGTQTQLLSELAIGCANVLRDIVKDKSDKEQQTTVKAFLTALTFSVGVLLQGVE